jgi:hypothetical protein
VREFSAIFGLGQLTLKFLHFWGVAQEFSAMFGLGDKHTRKRQEMTVKIAERRHKEKLARVTRWDMSHCTKPIEVWAMGRGASRNPKLDR